MKYPLQTWINGSVQQTLVDEEVKPDDLMEGKAFAFVFVHLTAMVELVGSSTTIKADMVPETLLFDVHRLASYQVEFHFLVTVTTMLVSAAHYLGPNAAIVARIGEEIIAPLRDQDQGRMLEAISGMLDQAALPVGCKEGVMHIVTQSSSPTDMVHKLMATRMKILVTSMVSSGNSRMLHEMRFMQAARPLFARIEQFADKLRSLTNMNRTVHLPTYNLLIGKAARELCRRPAVAAVGGVKRRK